MSNWNGAGAYGKTDVNDLQNAIGIPQFAGAAGTDWYLVFNGLLIQGGTINIPDGTVSYSFVTAFTQQVLGVFLQPVERHAPGVIATTLSTFDVIHTGATHDCYWWAIGV